MSGHEIKVVCEATELVRQIEATLNANTERGMLPAKYKTGTLFERVFALMEDAAERDRLRALNTEMLGALKEARRILDSVELSDPLDIEAMERIDKILKGTE